MRMRKKNYNTSTRAGCRRADWDAGFAAPMSAAVPTALGGLRLDQALARLFPQYSRNRLQAWLKSGPHHASTAARLRPSHAVTGGERVALQPPRVRRRRARRRRSACRSRSCSRTRRSS